MKAVQSKISRQLLNQDFTTFQFFALGGYLFLKSSAFICVYLRFH
jgi:hypothetical protein